MILDQPPLWLILVAFLAALGPLIFIHEFGHYIVGRWFGVGAETFSIGFGREVAGWTDRRGTRWKVGWMPMGGYVRFTGDMDPASMGKGLDKLTPEQRARSFHAKPVWQRFLIVLAGPAANFLLAIAVFAAFFAAFGAPRTAPIVGAVEPTMVAAEAGLRAGDRILGLNGEEVDDFEEIGRYINLRPDERIELSYQRGREVRSATLRVEAVELADRFGGRSRIGRIGIAGTQPQLVQLTPFQVLPAAVKHTAETTRAMATGLWQLVTGRRPVSELHGPMKMAQIAGQFASLGFFEFVQLVALFSINLGFINLLPVPMLDGGHLALYTVEAVRRRPLGERAQDWVFRGGLAALVTLFLFTTLNDLHSFGLWESIGRLMG
ncbi:MAG: Intramembrane protease RasP/YluC, implicated in cell division based on FtsL cleavage [uncultured Sphingomonas sp.]|uniref:Zinc metalloprotease n=1 Tax=uncultured Sphingomonas sp. TaxID=158754 RepID=A0A6J4T000_9SPHN|nr:MAG: Intramembrane protease RasP/YluC, implicated in cell division based on FtsL cleavage [uncultured Sphingomonas sp.]